MSGKGVKGLITGKTLVNKDKKKAISRFLRADLHVPSPAVDLSSCLHLGCFFLCLCVKSCFAGCSSTRTKRFLFIHIFMSDYHVLFSMYMGNLWYF